MAPYLTLFLNGVGWLPGFPRIMTNDALATALTRAVEVGPGRFGIIGDISCDIEVSCFVHLHESLPDVIHFL